MEHYQSKNSLIGQTYEKLTVIDEVKENGRYYVLVRCSCGTIKKIQRQHWKITKSCGCQERGRKQRSLVCQETITEREFLCDYPKQYRSVTHRKISKNNKTGHTGVYYHEASNTYSVSVCIKGNPMYLGRYAKLQDAVNARNAFINNYL